MNPSGGQSELRRLHLKLSRATTLPAYVKLAIDSKIIIDRES
jgi:hypothetical protein